jgi:hypothetical protein
MTHSLIELVWLYDAGRQWPAFVFPLLKMLSQTQRRADLAIPNVDGAP